MEHPDDDGDIDEDDDDEDGDDDIDVTAQGAIDRGISAGKTSQED